MGNIIDFFKHQSLANTAKNASKTAPKETLSHEKESSSLHYKPSITKLADDSSLYAYYELTRATQFNKTLDIATRLRSAGMLGQLKTLKNEQIQEQIAVSNASPNKRSAFPWDKKFSAEAIQFIHCLSPDTYIQPYKFTDQEQCKLIIHLMGDFEMLLFDDTGILVKRIILANHNYKVIELPPDTYHSFIALKPCAYIEINKHPNNPETHRTYADWAVTEDSVESVEYLQQLYSATIGDRVTR